MACRIRSAAIFACLLIALAGCLSPAERPDARAGTATDEFSKTIDVVGPLMIYNPLVGVKAFFKLVTRVDKQSHQYTHVIETEFRYNGTFIYFQLAADDKAQSLQLVPIKRERNIGSMDRGELFNIVVPDASLRAHAATGYRVKVSSRAGDNIVLVISPAMIAAQIEGLNRVLSPPAAASIGATSGSAVTAAAAPPPPPGQKRILGIAPMDIIFVSGALIARVDPGSPAEAAGLEVGDIIKSYDDHPINNAGQVRELILQTTPGKAVSIGIERNGAQMSLVAQM